MTNVDQLRKLVNADSSNLAFAWLADLEWKTGNADLALSILENGMQNNPSLTVAWALKGKVLRSLGHMDQAKTCFQKVIELDSFYLSSRLNLAEILIEQKKGEEAHYILRDLKELDSLAIDIPEVPRDILPVGFLLTGAGMATAEVVMPASQELTFTIDNSLMDSSFDELDGEIPLDELGANLEIALQGAVSTVDPENEVFPDGPVNSIDSAINVAFEAPAIPEVTAAEDVPPVVLVQPVPPAPPSPPIIGNISSAPQTQSLFSSMSVTPVPSADSVVDSTLYHPVSEEIEEIRVTQTANLELNDALDHFFSDDDVHTEPAEELGLDHGVAGALDQLLGNDSDSLLDDPEINLLEKAPAPDFTSHEENPISGLESLADAFLEKSEPFRAEESSTATALDESSLFKKSNFFAPSSAVESLLEQNSSETTLFEKTETFVPRAESTEVLVAENESLFEKSTAFSPTITEDLQEPVVSEMETTQSATPNEIASSANPLAELFPDDEDDIYEEPETNVPAIESSALLVETASETTPESSLLSELEQLQALEIEENTDDPALVAFASESAVETPVPYVAHHIGQNLLDEEPVEQNLFGDDDSEVDQNVSSAFNDFFGAEVADDHLEEEHLSAQTNQGNDNSFAAPPIASPVLEMPVDAPRESETMGKRDVENAFENLFGEEDEEWPEESSNTSPLPTLTMAELYEEQGHLAEALKIYQLLLEKDPFQMDLQGKVEDLTHRLNG